MLVIKRNIGESIVIGEQVRLKILRIDGNQVKIGFDAPDEVRIRRAEVPRVPRKPIQKQ